MKVWRSKTEIYIGVEGLEVEPEIEYEEEVDSDFEGSERKVTNKKFTKYKLLSLSLGHHYKEDH